VNEKKMAFEWRSVSEWKRKTGTEKRGAKRGGKRKWGDAAMIA